MSLSAKDENSVHGASKAPARTAAGEPGKRIECDLSEPGEVVLEPIHDPDQVKLFNELGYRQPVGCHPRYLVLDGHGRRLGCLQFQHASKKLQSREAWIGWDEDSRQKRLERGCNSRFLILPWVRVRNLASHVLSLAASRLAEDWKARWKARPVLIETFVDGSLHEGTIYMAAGWEKIGQSSGWHGTGSKDLHVKELQGDASAVLRG